MPQASSAQASLGDQVAAFIDLENLAQNGITLVQVTRFGAQQKNAADILLAVDAMEALITHPDVGTFAKGHPAARPEHLSSSGPQAGSCWLASRW